MRKALVDKTKALFFLIVKREFLGIKKASRNWNAFK